MEAAQGRRSRHPLHSRRRLWAGRRGDRTASQAGRDRLRRRLGQGRGGAGHGAASARRRALRAGHPVAGTEHSGPDAGFAELFINRWCILTPPEGTDPQAVGRLRASGRALGAKVETMDARPSRPGAGDHQPSAAPDRLHHRRHRRRTRQGHLVGSDEVLGRRFSRLHPHRGLRSDDVARRVPGQQGRGAGDARHLQRGPVQADRARSAATTARRCTTISPAPAPSAAASSRSARIRPRPTSAARTRNWEKRRSRGRPGKSPGPPKFNRRCRAGYPCLAQSAA